MKHIHIWTIVLFISLGNMYIGTDTVYADPSLPIIAEDPEYTIDIYPSHHKLVVSKQGKIIKTYRVAVGNPSTPTPVGEYLITYKGKNWGPSYGPRWLGLNVPWGHYGIHGTNKPYSIGQHRSHGCIRMYNHEVIELFDLVPIGTKVTIFGHVLGDWMQSPRNLAAGDIGGDVQLVQNRLKSAGYYDGMCDGKFDANTTAALRRYQRDLGLPENGVVSSKVYQELGLIE
ncbi:hypothetical protein CHH75_01805 [Paenibacillus sp. 7541]|uniref:L,D-transpeptidase family protein n=2 Tax=Paenibacillus TaxID=44249 RepID=A0A268EUQ5_9BACL|nr:L,D-transpeptidase family protein [Paenibacillus campinasensis]PAD76850.1 hypothetical protein CHH67_11460 [Paenibacillus campinasensis]PAK55681.1 hypothetical protein CHH75_01805 [Paenibacillus sp. 7541]